MVLGGALPWQWAPVPNPLLGGSSLSPEGAVSIVNNFADGHDDLLVRFKGPAGESVEFTVVCMRLQYGWLSALMQAASTEVMEHFNRMRADHAPAGMELAIAMDADPATGVVPDPVQAATLRSITVPMVPKN